MEESEGVCETEVADIAYVTVEMGTERKSDAVLALETESAVHRVEVQSDCGIAR